MSDKVILSKAEEDAVLASPECLEELANYHECQATMADALGEVCFRNCVEHHEERAKMFRQLKAEREAVQATW